MNGNDLFQRRVARAAGAMWWTVLIAVIWVVLAWLSTLWIFNARAEWVARLWYGIDWDTFRSIVISVIMTIRIILFVMILAAIWLSLWARGLRKG